MLLYTTDYKGKILNFAPKSMPKSRLDLPGVAVRVQTMVESGRNWLKGSQNRMNIQTNHEL